MVERGSPGAAGAPPRRAVLGGSARPPARPAVAHRRLGLPAPARGRGPALAAIRRAGPGQLGPAAGRDVAGRCGAVGLLQKRPGRPPRPATAPLLPPPPPGPSTRCLVSRTPAA